MVSFTSFSLAAVAAISLVTPSLANGGFNFSPSLQLGRRAAAPAPKLEFSACQQAAAAITPKPTYIIYANHTVDVNGLPAVCIASLEAHNAQANISEINKWEGWGIVLNDTAIQTSGVGNGLTAYLESIATNLS